MNEGAAWQPRIHVEVVAIFVYEPVFLYLLTISLHFAFIIVEKLMELKRLKVNVIHIIPKKHKQHK